MRILFFLLGLLAAGVAMAEPDTFGLGTGRNGVLQVDQPNTVINRAGQLTATAAAGTKVLTLTNAAAFTVGELVLVHQSLGLPAPDSGNQNSINLGSSPVGRFEYARVELVGGGSLQLTAPLQYSYAASVSQVVNVPEYTEVHVLSNASLRAPPWNGSSGGILALLASGMLVNNGTVSADGAGFRGGAFINHPGGEGCTSLDEAAGVGASYKGEGLVAGRFGTASGRGNLATGGGGGNCHSAGGGGGGHFGLGGKGGNTPGEDPQPDAVGGLGGAPVVYLPYQRLLFGGGGGGGAGHVDTGTPGAPGGGLVIIRADNVVGNGRFSATGASADFVTSQGDDGAGGGGAGGAISLRVARALRCGVAQAAGGTGGDTRHVSSESGPGGGGGGGAVFLQAETLACPVSVVAGQPGQSTSAGGTYGAGPSVIDSGPSYGFEQTVESPFRVLATPVVTRPANGATGVAPRPRIEGTADPGVIVQLYLDGVPYVRVVPDSTGAFSYNVPTDLAGGAHELQASAEELGTYSPRSAPNSFDVVTPVGDGGVPDGGPPDGGPPDGGPPDGGPPDGGPPDGGPPDGGPPDGGSPVGEAPNAFEVGCGCGASSGAGLGIVALLLSLGAARLRQRE